MAPDPAPGPAQGTLADRAVDVALRGLIGAAMRLPYERRVAFMGRAVARVAGPLAGYRRRALANLALVRPGWSEAQRREVARACLDNFGRTLIEIYSHAELLERARAMPIGGGGLPHLERAAAEKRPVVFVTGHFGNHEVARYALVSRGFRIGGMYREMDNPYVNAHYVRVATAVSSPGFPKSRRGTMGFVRHLKGGGMATILFDLHDRDGVPIPFLGRPALTATTAADLSLRLGALLLPYWGTRRPDGVSFDLVLEEPVDPAEPVAMMADLTRRLEARVEAHPGQWFWVHRRWKGAPDPAQPGPAKPGSGPA